MFDADLVQDEVDPPLQHWCCSGHYAPLMFRRSGPSSVEEPTRFFHVKGHGIDGIFCEPCLIVAHHISNLQKQGLIGKE
jgi:hypothetical protein